MGWILFPDAPTRCEHTKVVGEYVWKCIRVHTTGRHVFRKMGSAS